MVRTTSSLALLCAVLLPACGVAGPRLPTPDQARQATLDDAIRRLDDGETALAVERLATVAALCPVDGMGRRALMLLAATELDPAYEGRRPDVAARLAAFQLARPSRVDPWAAPLARDIYTIALDYGATPVAATEIPDASILWQHYFTGGAGATGVAGMPLGAGVDTAGAVEGAEGDAPIAVAARGGVVAGPPPPDDRRGGPVCEVGPPDATVVMPELVRAPLATRSGAVSTDDRAAPAADPADTRALMAEVDRLRNELARKEQELDRIRRTLRP